MILTSSYTRVQAAPDESFLGWKDFVHELNLFLNKFVTKGGIPDLEYASLDRTEYWRSPDQATIKVFIGEEPPLDYDPQKLISGTKYFLGEHGLKIEEVQQDAETWDAMVSGLSRYKIPQHYQKIRNTWMKDALLHGTVIDVREVGVEVEPGVFKLSSFVPNTQYVDSESEQFIFSIGKDKDSGEILATYDTRFYGDDDYETLYLH